MAGSDDRGLDLRLPWGRSSPAQPEPPGPTSKPRARRQGAAPQPPPSPARHLASGFPAVEDEAASAAPPGAVEPDSAPFDLTDQRNAAFATRLDERLERLELGLSARLDRLEQQADTHDAGLEARLEKLEIQLQGANDASLEAVGMLAGQLIARLEEQITGVEQALQTRNARLEAQVSGIEPALQARLEEQVGGFELALQARHERLVEQLTADMGQGHQELVGKVEAGHHSAMEAMSGLASGALVDRLLEGVVALGEVLDADLVNLRRLITQEHLGPSRPAVELHDFGEDALGVPEEGDLDEPADPSSEDDDEQ